MKRTSFKRLLPIAITAMLSLLVVATGVSVAQQPDSGLALEPAALYSQTWTFSYQGRLLDGGVPANGHYDFAVNVYSHPVTAGSWVAACIDVGPGLVDYQVNNGLFTFYLLCNDDNSTVFTGGDRWIEVQVASHGTGITTTLSRQPIAPTPYAFSLFPGAIVSGTVTNGSFGASVLNVSSQNTVATGSAIRAKSATGSAMLGESVDGSSIYGYTENGYGVYGFDGGSTQAKGYAGYFYSNTGVGVYGYSNGTRTHPNIYSPGVYGRSANGVGVYGRSNTSSVSWTSAGVMGWGDANPGGKFYSHTGNSLEGWEDQAGDGLMLNLRFKVDHTGEVYADGGYHCGKDSSCWYASDPADFAEVLPAANETEPGDVLVADVEGRLVRSTESYQTNVLGVYSTNPMYIGNGRNMDQEGYAPLAVVGIVPVKASAENGAIRPGDLLTTSATPGHAMRAGSHPPIGTVIGKALGTLQEGMGVIQILVTLQ